MDNISNLITRKFRIELIAVGINYLFRRGLGAVDVGLLPNILTRKFRIELVPVGVNYIARRGLGSDSTPIPPVAGSNHGGPAIRNRRMRYL